MIPSKEQWENAWEGLDAATAFEHFFGKSPREAQAQIEQAPELYCEDFLWMPSEPFRFYLPAFLAYLVSPSSEGDSYAAYSFLGLIRSRLADLKSTSTDLWDPISRVLDHLSDNQSFYDPSMDEGVYSKLVSRIRARISKLQA